MDAHAARDQSETQHELDHTAFLLECAGDLSKTKKGYRMPIDLRILDNGVGVRYVFTGLVTGKELIQLNTALYASGKQLQKIKYAIVDESQMDSLDLTFVELKKIEDMDKQAARRNPHIVVALVVVKDLPLNITRAWEVRTQDLPWDKKIFGSNDEACAWVREKVREKFGEAVTVSAE